MKITSTVRLKDDMVEELTESHEYTFKKKDELTDDDKINTEIFVTYGWDLKDGEADAFPNLKWLHVMSAGVDEIPEEFFNEALVTNSSGIHKVPMSEFALGYILDYYKNLSYLNRAQENREWINYSKSEELYGKEAHILGTGNIGSRLAEVLQVLGVKTVGYNTNGRSIEGFDLVHSMNELNEKVVTADILVNILPSTNKTKNLLTADIFKVMKSNAIFTNIGRGDIMTDDTLKEILTEKYIAHVMSDVFNEEPLPSDSPFYDFDNLTITPHCSAKTDMYLYRAFDIFKENLGIFKTSTELINLIDYNKGY